MSAYLRSRWSTGCAPPFKSRACHRASAVAASVPRNRNWRTHQDEQYVLFNIRRLSARAHEHWGGRVRQFIRAGASRLLDRSQTGGLTSTVMDRSHTNLSFTTTSRGRKRHNNKARFTEGPAARQRRVRDGGETEPRLHSQKWRAQLPLRSTSMIWESGDRESAKSGSLATAAISWLLDRQAPRHRGWRTARLGRHAGSRTILLRDAVELGRQRRLPVRRRDAEHFLQPG